MELNARQPNFHASITITPAKGEEPITLTYEGDVPKDIMDQATALVGNALSRVGISVDLSGKDFGKGVQASAHVSLSCNQDTETIQKAAQLAGYFAMEFAKMYESMGKSEYEGILKARGGK